MELLENQNTGLQENKAQEIEDLYAPMVKLLKGYEEEFNLIVKEEVNDETIGRAKDLKKKIANTRIEADKVRKKSKSQYLIAGNAIQSAYNTFLYATKSKEEKLKEIVDFHKIANQKRIDAIKEERVNMLKQYTTEFPDNLGEFTEQVWESYFLGVRGTYQKKLDAEAEEKRLEEQKAKQLKKHYERKDELSVCWAFVDKVYLDTNFGELTKKKFKVILETAMGLKNADDEKQAEIKFENDRLKAIEKERLEKVKKELEAKEKREKAIENRLIELGFVKEERENYVIYLNEGIGVQVNNLVDLSDKDLKKQMDITLADIEIKRNERLENLKIAEELDQKKKKEAKELEEKKRLEEQELLKGDKEKFNDMLNDLAKIQTKYTFKSQTNIRKYKEVNEMVGKIINHIKK